MHAACKDTVTHHYAPLCKFWATHESMVCRCLAAVLQRMLCPVASAVPHSGGALASLLVKLPFLNARGLWPA
eukprot:scaffold144993_cov19-Tisochrysis_lutea.AAC.2